MCQFAETIMVKPNNTKAELLENLETLDDILKSKKENSLSENQVEKLTSQMLNAFNEKKKGEDSVVEAVNKIAPPTYRQMAQTATCSYAPDLYRQHQPFPHQYQPQYYYPAPCTGYYKPRLPFNSPQTWYDQNPRTLKEGEPKDNPQNHYTQNLRPGLTVKKLYL